MTPAKTPWRIAVRGTQAVWHGLGRAWHWVRHPPGWYDEIDAVYDRHTTPDGTKSAATAAIGGMISGGGGVG